MTGPEFDVKGEIPGRIGDDLHQEVVAKYLGSLDGPYNTTLQGRLRNDTSAFDYLDLVQTPDSCRGSTYWSEDKKSCLDCPQVSNVAFSDEKVEFSGQQGSKEVQSQRVILVNREIFSVSIVPKSIPAWVALTPEDPNLLGSNGDPIKVDGGVSTLGPGESIACALAVSAMSLEAGTALGTVAFGVLGGASYPGCVGSDVTFDVFMRVTPEPNNNVLGSFWAVGFTLMGIAVATALAFACWVYANRMTRIVKTLQPSFLMILCAGLMIVALSIIPLSFDDGSASIQGCNIACMAAPWLLSMGFTVTFSALIAKLWRINRIFNSAQFRRTAVTERDVIAPFIVLFTLNFGLLLSWTLADPLQWEREPVNEQEPWNTYGFCASNGTAGRTLFGLVRMVIFIAFALSLRSHSL